MSNNTFVGNPKKSFFKQPSFDTSQLSSVSFVSVTAHSGNLFESWFFDNPEKKYLIFLSENDYQRLTRSRIDKKDLIVFSMSFLFGRIDPKFIKPFFNLTTISNNFDQFEIAVKNFCEQVN